MRCRALGLVLLVLAGCHGPADDFAKLDVATPATASGWEEFRHEPGGYGFQAPRSYVIDPQDDARRLFGQTGSDLNLFLRLVDLDAARKGDLVSFAVTRLAFGGSSDLRVRNLDALGEQALKGMRMNSPDAKHERLTLPVGKAEHVWATMDKTLPNGTRQAYVSHLVVFATALRPFVLMYGYPAAKEAEYRPILDGIVRSVRLFLPKRDGKVTIPVTAHATETAMALPVFAGTTAPPALLYGGGKTPTMPGPSTNPPTASSPGERQPTTSPPGQPLGTSDPSTPPSASIPGGGSTDPANPLPPSGVPSPTSGTTAGNGGPGTAPPGGGASSPPPAGGTGLPGAVPPPTTGP